MKPAPVRPGPGRRWISPAEAAKLLGVHVMTVYDWTSAGRIPSARIGRKVLIDAVRLEQDLEAQSAGQSGGKGKRF